MSRQDTYRLSSAGFFPLQAWDGPFMENDIFLEKLSCLIAIIRRFPIYLFVKMLNHQSLQFYLAVSNHALFEIFDVSTFNCKSLQVSDRWRMTGA
jgi:hypothetical protein